MTDAEIVYKVLGEHPCFAINGVKMYTYLECKRMLEEALNLKKEE